MSSANLDFDLVSQFLDEKRLDCVLEYVDSFLLAHSHSLKDCIDHTHPKAFRNIFVYLEQKHQSWTLDTPGCPELVRWMESLSNDYPEMRTIIRGAFDICDGSEPLTDFPENHHATHMWEISIKAKIVTGGTGPTQQYKILIENARSLFMDVVNYYWANENAFDQIYAVSQLKELWPIICTGEPADSEISDMYATILDSAQENAVKDTDPYEELVKACRNKDADGIATATRNLIESVGEKHALRIVEIWKYTYFMVPHLTPAEHMRCYIEATVRMYRDIPEHGKFHIMTVCADAALAMNGKYGGEFTKIWFEKTAQYRSNIFHGRQKAWIDLNDMSLKSSNPEEVCSVLHEWILNSPVSWLVDVHQLLQFWHDTGKKEKIAELFDQHTEYFGWVFASEINGSDEIFGLILHSLDHVRCGEKKERLSKNLDRLFVALKAEHWKRVVGKSAMTAFAASLIPVVEKFCIFPQVSEKHVYHEILEKYSASVRFFVRHSDAMSAETVSKMREFMGVIVYDMIANHRFDFVQKIPESDVVSIARWTDNRPRKRDCERHQSAIRNLGFRIAFDTRECPIAEMIENDEGDRICTICHDTIPDSHPCTMIGCMWCGKYVSHAFCGYKWFEEKKHCPYCDKPAPTLVRG